MKQLLHALRNRLTFLYISLADFDLAAAGGNTRISSSLSSEGSLSKFSLGSSSKVLSAPLSSRMVRTFLVTLDFAALGLGALLVLDLAAESAFLVLTTVAFGLATAFFAILFYLVVHSNQIQTGKRVETPTFWTEVSKSLPESSDSCTSKSDSDSEVILVTR